MKMIIIRIILGYWLIATFFILNLTFNPNLRLVFKNEETGEETEPPYWIPIIFSITWIFFVIEHLFIFIKRGKNK